jgi:hypothetical protein
MKTTASNLNSIFLKNERELISIGSDKQQHGEDGVKLLHLVGLSGVPDQAV